MKQYTITQHPFKITFEIDDQWLSRFGSGFSDTEIQATVDNLEKEFRQIAVIMHAAAAQQEANETMNEL